MTPTTSIVRRSVRRARELATTVGLVTAGLLLVHAAAPAQAHAVDLFPVDDWIGDGLKSIGKIALGPLKLGAEGIAKLLAAIVAALADLLIPKSLIEAGIDGVRWLVELPPLGASAAAAGQPLEMPHLVELRDTLTWIGLTLLPLQIVVAGGRSILSPTADGDSPTIVLQRTIAAAVGLIAFDWLWGAMTQLVHLVTTSLLSLPWVADGVRRMLQALVIGGAAGTVVASEFVVPLMLAVAGVVLLALMLFRVGLEVIASIVYATGGLALGLSVSGIGHRVLHAWSVAALAVFVLPVLWCIVFVCGAALMLDAGSADANGGFGDFVAQLYNIGAALVTFGLAIKIARTVLGLAGSAMAGLAVTARMSGAASRGGRAGATRAAANSRATPQSLARFSQQVRGGMKGTAAGVARIGMFPVRHPVQTTTQARHPIQATQGAAKHLSTSVKDGIAAGTSRGETERVHYGDRDRRNAGSERRARSSPKPDGSTEPRRPRRSSPPVGTKRQPPAHRPAAPARPVAPAAGARPPEDPADQRRGNAAASAELRDQPGAHPRREATDAGVARAWRTTRRVTAPRRLMKKTTKRKGKKP